MASCGLALHGDGPPQMSIAPQSSPDWLSCTGVGRAVPAACPPGYSNINLDHAPSLSPASHIARILSGKDWVHSNLSKDYQQNTKQTGGNGCLAELVLTGMAVDMVTAHLERRAGTLPPEPSLLSNRPTAPFLTRNGDQSLHEFPIAEPDCRKTRR